MSSYTKMKKIFLRGLLWLYLFGFGYMALTLEPGFLDFDNLPDTNFTCVGKVIGGYYADLETNCQMFHVCTIGQLDEPMDIRFLCLNGTVFDQETRVCERVDEVDCSKSERFYSLNLELYGNSQPTNLEENSETEQPLIIKSTLPTTTTTTSTEATRKTTRPSYYTSSTASPVKSSTSQLLNHHFPVVSPNSADIRFNPEEINISLKLGAPPFIRTKPSFHGPSAGYSVKTPGYSDKSAGYSDKSPGYSDQKVIVTTHRGAFDNNGEKRKEGDGASQVQAPSVQKTVANVHGYGSRPTPSDINYEFSYTDSSELEGYQTENYQFQKEFRPSQQYSGPLHNPITPQYQSTTFRTLTTPSANNYQQQKSSTTNRNIYIQSLKPPAPNQQNHYAQHAQHQTEKAPHRIQLPLPFFPTLPPLTFSSPAPFTLHHHIDAKRYTKEHVSPPRIIISASASVSDASGRRLNYSLGTIGAAQILEDAPNSYDDYKETDVALDPFYHDVPKLKHSARRKRSTTLKQQSLELKTSHRKKRNAEEAVKHSDIIKNDQDAVNVLKFLFDWYRNEKTNPASTTTTPKSTPLEVKEIQTINEELSSPKPVETKIEISTGASEQDPLGISLKSSDLFNKKSKFSIVGDDKYAVTHEEVKKVNQVQQNLSFSDTREAPKYSFLDDYVDDNYEPETYKSKYGFEDDHDRFKYSSFLGDMDIYEDKDPMDDKYFSDDKDDYYEKDLKDPKHRSVPKDYVDDNIEPLYYKDRYSDSEDKNKILEQRSSSERMHATTVPYNEENVLTTTETYVPTSHQKNEKINYDDSYEMRNEESQQETTTENEIHQSNVYEKEYTSKILQNSKPENRKDQEITLPTIDKGSRQRNVFRQKHRTIAYNQPEGEETTPTVKKIEEKTFYEDVNKPGPQAAESLTHDVHFEEDSIKKKETNQEESEDEKIFTNGRKDTTTADTKLVEGTTRESKQINRHEQQGSENLKLNIDLEEGSTMEKVRTENDSEPEKYHNNIKDESESSKKPQEEKVDQQKYENESQQAVSLKHDLEGETIKEKQSTEKDLHEEKSLTNLKEETTTIQKLEEERFYQRKHANRHRQQTTDNLKHDGDAVNENETAVTKELKQKTSSRRKTAHVRKTKNDSSRKEDNQQTNTELEGSDEPASQVEKNKPLSQAHLESIEIEELVETATKATHTLKDNVMETNQTKTTTDAMEISPEPLDETKYHHQNSSIQLDVKTNNQNKSAPPALIATTTEINIPQQTNNVQSLPNDIENITKSQSNDVEIQQISTESSLPQETSKSNEDTFVANSRTENSTVVTDVSRSAPEINIVVSKAFKTNKTRIRSSSRGRHKYKDPEVSSKNTRLEKRIEKPYRAKDDYDYLKTVSNVQSSTEKDSSETNNTINTHDEDRNLVKANDLLLPPSSSTEQPKSIRRRGRPRHKIIETTSVRNIRRRRPTQNSINTDHHHRLGESEFSTVDKIVKVSSTTNDSNQQNDTTTEQSRVVNSTNSQEPLSEIIETTTSSSEAISEQKVELVQLSHQVTNTEHQTTMPVVDTTQTTPVTTVIEKENLGTTNHPVTKPTFVEERKLSTTIATSPEQLTQVDKIQEIYATSFVPTEKIHITKKKELKVNEEEDISTTADFYTQPIEISSQPTTIWNSPNPKENDNIVSHSFNIPYSTTHLPITQQETVATTFKTDSPSTILETTTEAMSTNLDAKTTEIPLQEVTKEYSAADETQAPKNVWVTENLQKLIEEIETTTRSIAADPVVKVIPHHHVIKNMHLDEQTTTETVPETTLADAILTTNDIKSNFLPSGKSHNVPEQTSAETRGETVAPIFHHKKELESTTFSDELTTTLLPETSETPTTIQPSPSTEQPTTTYSTRAPRTRGRPSRKRPSDYQTPRTGYRHRFSTDAFTRRPENRKQTIEEEIINTIARRSKQLTTEPTKVKKLKQIHTDVPLRKSIVPTQSEKIEESLLTTPLSRKTTVRKYYFFNCFNKEVNKFYPDPRDCRLFHYCTQGYTKNQLLDMKFVCDFNTFFDDENLVCTKKKPKRCL